MGESKQGSAAGILLVILLVIVAAFSVFFFSPGILIMGTIQYIAGTKLDQGQMWTFAILLCLFIWGAIWTAQEKDSWAATKTYLSICLSITSVSLILHFGFKAKFIVVFLQYFFK